MVRKPRPPPPPINSAIQPSALLTLPRQVPKDLLGGDCRLFRPLPAATREQIIYGSLERGCYSLSQGCFCNVPSSAALKYVIQNSSSSHEYSKASAWHFSLCSSWPGWNSTRTETAIPSHSTNTPLASSGTPVPFAANSTVCFPSECLAVWAFMLKTSSRSGHRPRPAVAYPGPTLRECSQRPSSVALVQSALLQF